MSIPREKQYYDILPPNATSDEDLDLQNTFYTAPTEGKDQSIDLRCIIDGKVKTITLHNILSVEDWIPRINITRIDAFWSDNGLDHRCVANIHTGPTDKLHSELTVYRKEN